MRPSWDEYFLGMAAAASARADCRRSKVGAVLVNGKPPRIVGTGYNGTVPGAPGCLAGACPRGQRSYSEQGPGGDYGDCIAIHAEINAVDWAPQEAVPNSTLYITREPCFICMTVAMVRGVTRFVWPEGSWPYAE